MSDDDLLSQEEIDALMNDGDSDESEERLTEEDKDILGEVGNIAMGSAATALYTLLDQKVEITAPQVELVNFADITKQYEVPCVLVKVEYIEGLEGVNLLIIEEKDAAIIADLMMGGDGTDVDEEINEIQLSAVGEAMNQMMGSSSTAMSSIINGVVNITPPEAEYLQLKEAVEDQDNYFEKDEKLVATSFQLKIGDLIDSSFKQLARLDFTRQLVDSLKGEESGGLTAKDDNVQQEQVSAVTEEQTASQQKEEPAAAATEAGGGRDQGPQPSSGKVKKESVGVKTAQFPNFGEEVPDTLPQNMELIKDVPLEVTVRLGKTRMKIEEILDLGEGSIIELDKLAGEPVDLLVNGKLVAKGEVVVIDENFGFRVKDIISPMERLNKEIL